MYNGNYKADKGDGLEDQPNRFVVSWVWSPTFTHRSGAFYKYVVNNWQLSSITTINGRRPYASPTVNVTDTPVTGMFSNFNLDGNGLSERVPFWAVNSMWQPAMYRDDARISKILPFGERYKLFLNFEVFNVSNSWSPTSLSTQAFTEAKGVLTLTPTAYGVGTADSAPPDGTQARTPASERAIYFLRAAGNLELELTNKVAMVAGASRGLGFAVARALAKEGVRVSISSRNADAIAAAGARIEQETGGAVLAMPADVRSAEAIEQWFKATVDRFGGVDLLYPNSGGPPPARRSSSTTPPGRTPSSCCC